MTNEKSVPTVEIHPQSGYVLFVPKGTKEKLSTCQTMRTFLKNPDSAISEEALSATGKTVLKAIRTLKSHIRKITIGPFALKIYFGSSGSKDGQKRLNDAHDAILNAIQSVASHSDQGRLVLPALSTAASV